MCSDAYKEVLRKPGEITLSPWKSVASGSLSGHLLVTDLPLCCLGFHLRSV